MTFNAEAVAKNMIKRAGAWRFHRLHRAQATSILRTLEKTLGRTNSKDIDRADEYAREVLGDACYAPWLYVYSAVAGRFKEGWIPDNYYGRIVVPRINGGYGHTSNLKALQYTTFESDAFPDLGYFANGMFLTREGTPMAPESVSRRFFDQCDSLLFKVDESLQGRGIFFFDRHTFDLEKVKALGNGVFQKKISQNETFARFSPRSVATLRVTTVIDDAGDIAVRGCYLRLGRSADTHVQAGTNVRVPVDRVTGALGDTGYLPDWSTVRAHPDSHVPFAGVTVPVFEQCAATAIAHHRKVPFVRSIGWDVTVDDEGAVRLMEWNGKHNDIKFSEATQGPCFTDMGWERFAPGFPSRRRPMLAPRVEPGNFELNSAGATRVRRPAGVDL